MIALWCLGDCFLICHTGVTPGNRARLLKKKQKQAFGILENRPPLQGALLNFGAEKGPNAVNVGADRKDKVKNKGGLREQEEPDAIPDGAGKHKSDKDLKLAGMVSHISLVSNLFAACQFGRYSKLPLLWNTVGLCLHL